MELKVKKLTDTARLPEKAHQGDLGYDVFADEDKWIPPGEYKLVSSIKIEKGDKISQLVPTKVYNFEIEQVAELHKTKRGGDGFGSTGK